MEEKGGKMVSKESEKSNTRGGGRLFATVKGGNLVETGIHFASAGMEVRAN